MSKLIQKSKSIFSHNHVFTGHGGSTPYLHYKDGGGVTDGINRQHIDLYGRCDICNKEILVAKIHIKANGMIYGLKNK